VGRRAQGARQGALLCTPSLSLCLSLSLSRARHATPALLCSPLPCSPCCTIKSLGLGDDVAQLCAEPKIVDEINKQVKAVCKSKLVGFETPKKIGLVADPWSVENDLLTAAMKLKRIPIVARHKDELDVLYS